MTRCGTWDVLAEYIAERKKIIGSGLDSNLEFFTDMMKSMPALELFAQVMAARVMNPARKVKANDIYDNEIAVFAPAYVDIIVTERGLADLLENRCSLPRERGCKIAVGIQGLLDILTKQSV